ncbi:hypothetical protein B0T09DRAFT_37375 [Sordaria sp. MPI-SDFR-AT-0083]|nr:hypothetical protein B0T09DRAFT_37375 [Sordaria sp. MPI-SDFR-AT-0083]
MAWILLTHVSLCRSMHACYRHSQDLSRIYRLNFAGRQADLLPNHCWVVSRGCSLSCGRYQHSVNRRMSILDEQDSGT